MSKVLATLALFVWLCWPATAADIPCGTWEAVKQRFATKFHEVPIGGGIMNPSTILQLLVSLDGATWTAVIVGSNGMACVIAVGRDWETDPLPTKGRRG